MQFTEVAELNDNIDLLRVGTRVSQTGNQQDYQSPVYHDPDRDIAVLFNNSPPAENYYKVKTTDRYNRYDSRLQHHQTSETLPNNKANPSHRQPPQAHAANPPDPKTSGDVPAQAPKAEEQKSEQGVFTFERLPVVPPQESTKSDLTAMLAKVQGSGGMGHSGPLLSLVIYLPNRVRMDLKVPKSATVEDAIKQVVRQRREEEKPTDKPMHQPRMYELRLHDEDGMPDEDFPALESNGLIGNFSDGDTSEFCLCEISGATSIPSSEDDTAPTEELSTSLATDHLRKLEVALDGRRVVKVFLSDNGQYTVLPVSESLKAYQLLAMIQKKQRLPLFKDEYQFKVSEQDRQAHRLLTNIIDMNTDIHSLGIQNLELCRRRYADAPEYLQSIEKKRAQQAVGKSRSAAEGTPAPATNQFEKREDPENFLFNELTSAVYEEWDIVKTNKWGKRQKRVMGIDYEKIYNKHRLQHGKGKLSNLAVKRAERLLIDVLEIKQVENNPSAFTILFREGKWDDTKVLLEYEADAGPAAAALIIAKIKYNQNRILNKHE